MYKVKMSYRIKKYIKNALLAPLWLVLWLLAWIFFGLNMITAGPLRIMAGIAFIADVVCWIIGKQAIGQFALILIPIAVAVAFPFGFGGLATLFGNKEKKIRKYWFTPVLASEFVTSKEKGLQKV